MRTVVTLPPAARLAHVIDAQPAAITYESLTPTRALALPLAFTAALAVLGLLPAVRSNTNVLWSFWGAAGALFVWNTTLAVAAGSRRTFSLEVVFRKQHYLQACAQGSIFLYWGWYWREVYHAAHLIAAQLLFAYALDMLLGWSRRRTYTLGFGPFPIIFSINLFLWFKPDWFYLQFVMVATGFLAKELIRWNKDGRRTHIFNPSSFPLGLFSLALILTGTTDITWGREIATTLFHPPQIYLMIFLVGLPGQFLFGVTPMTMSAVLTTYGLGLAYFAATGTYYFFDEYVPIAVFLGMHLLFTDPSTSPRTELGRIIFGFLYGASVFVLYGLLAAIGAPTFYDKLMAVPILNLTIQAIDRAASSDLLKGFDPARLGRAVTARQRNASYIAVWTVAFIALSAVQGVGDTHRGHWVPFWQQACQEGRRNACRNLATMEATYCEAGSGWACNELALTAANAKLIEPALQTFQRACTLGFAPACENAGSLSAGRGPLASGQPQLSDYRVVLREGKGPVPDLPPVDLYARACRQGWTDGCRQACELGLTSVCGTPASASIR